MPAILYNTDDTITELDDTIPLEKAQELVGGYVEAIYGRTGDGQPVQYLLDEEGKLKNYEPNLGASTDAWLHEALSLQDLLVGPVIKLTGSSLWK